MTIEVVLSQIQHRNGAHFFCLSSSRNRSKSSKFDGDTMNPQIKLDSKQLRELLDSFKPKERRGMTFDRGVELAKLVAIACAGIWTIYLYNTSQVQRDALTLEQTKLQNTRAELDYALAERKADVESSGQFLLEVSLDPVEEDSDKPMRRIDLHYDIKNQGEVALTVSKVIVEWYVGKLEAGSISRGIVLHNEPPIGALQGNYPKINSPVVWARTTYIACLFQDSENDFNGQDYRFQQGGCGTNTYQPGEGMKQTSEALITSRNTDFIGASIYVVYGPSGNEKFRFNALSQYWPTIPSAKLNQPALSKTTQQ